MRRRAGWLIALKTSGFSLRVATMSILYVSNSLPVKQALIWRWIGMKLVDFQPALGVLE
jgi:hypothetical protein